MPRQYRKPRETPTESEGLSSRMRELLSKATVEERRKAESERSGDNGERRRRNDEKDSDHFED